MNDDMHLSPTGAQFLKLSEEDGGQCRLSAYDDGTGTPTICWGCTKGVKMGMSLTQQECDALFAEEIAPCEGAIKRLITVPVSQPLFDILVSFFYNNGWGKCSSLIAAVNSGDDAQIRKAWMQYVHARNERTGELTVWPGLVKRRSAELQYWATYSAQANKIQPPGVAAPVETPVQTAARSRTIGAALVAAFWSVVGVFEKFPDVIDQARPEYDAGRQTAEWLHFNWTAISVAFALTCITVVIVRHFLDKRTIANG